MARRLLLIGTAVWFCLGADLASQEPASGMKTGDRVRVHRVAEADKMTGTFTGRDGTNLQLISDSAQTPISIPMAEISKLERSTGRHGHTLAGLGVGAGIGLGLGLAAAASSDPNSFVEIGASEVAVGTVLFAGVGALVGTLVRSESWVEVPLASLEPPPFAPDTTAPIIAPIAVEP